MVHRIYFMLDVLNYNFFTFNAKKHIADGSEKLVYFRTLQAFNKVFFFSEPSVVLILWDLLYTLHLGVG